MFFNVCKSFISEELVLFYIIFFFRLLNVSGVFIEKYGIFVNFDFIFLKWVVLVLGLVTVLNSVI